VDNPYGCVVYLLIDEGATVRKQLISTAQRYTAEFDLIALSLLLDSSSNTS
jgi:hypothetical protein